MAEENQYHEFDVQALDEAMSAVQSIDDGGQMAAAQAGQMSFADTGEMSLAAQCISVSTASGKICLNLPLGIGKVCFPVPGWIPKGQTVQACISICYIWKIPRGVKLTLSYNGNVFFTKKWGSC
jgi:hypothetical protein